MEELDKGTVARYCKPSTIDEKGQPTSSSYQLRKPNEEYLSVYLLDYFSSPEESDAIKNVAHVMTNKGFKLKKTGLFSTLDIVGSKLYIEQMISQCISYRSLNLPHCGIFHDYDDLVISELLSHCTKNCYPTSL